MVRGHVQNVEVIIRKYSGNCFNGRTRIFGVRGYKNTQNSINVNYCFALVGAILSFLNGNWFDWRLILGFIPGIIVLFLGLLTKETIGYGDGLVVLALGCYLNIFEIIGLSMLALTLAGLAAVFLIVVYHKGKKELLPFVPFLFVAHLIVVLL